MFGRIAAGAGRQVRRQLGGYSKRVLETRSSSVTLGSLAPSWSDAAPDFDFAGRRRMSSSPSSVTDDAAVSESSLSAVQELANQAAVAVLDPSRAELGWGPVDLCTSFIDYIHVTAGLPWWQSLLLVTGALRLAVFPLNVRQMRNALRMKELQPELMILQQEMKEKPAESMEDRAYYARKMQGLQEKHGVSMWGTMIGPLSQIPIFLTMFWTLRRMATDYPSFSEGGTLWFNNLAEADPTYGLPILCSLSFIAMVELGTSDAPPASGNKEQQERMKIIMRVLGLTMLPITATQPAAIGMYWAASNAFSILQSGFLKIPGIKSAFGVTIKNPVSTPAPHQVDYSTAKTFAQDPTKRSRKSRRDRGTEA